MSRRMAIFTRQIPEHAAIGDRFLELTRQGDALLARLERAELIYTGKAVSLARARIRARLDQVEAALEAAHAELAQVVRSPLKARTGNARSAARFALEVVCARPVESEAEEFDDEEAV